MKVLARTMATAAFAMAAASGSPAGAARGMNSCRTTSEAALRGCRASAQGDKWIAVGKCANLSDGTATKTCDRQAAADARDALKTCKEQHGLRRAVCSRLGEGPYIAKIDPANFVDAAGHPLAIDNPFFPVPPGTTFVYEGQTADGFEHVEFAVTHATRTILGVTCVEVHDTRKVNGEVLEDTRDWFAQDRDGNVWYFGENTTLVSDGLPVDLSGSWTGGVDGAQPGFIMEAHPAVGDFYRQEFLLGEAEDLAEVKSLSESVTVPHGSFDHCLKTEESSPLAPGDVENKFYAAGVGNLLTVDLATGERSELVSITMQ